MDRLDILNKIEETLLTIADGQIYRRVIDDTEKILIEKILAKAHGNQLSAAKILGLNRNTLRAKINKYKINLEQYRL